MLTNQNKALLIILTNQNKILCTRIKQRSGFQGQLAVRLNIFSNIQLINKKFCSDVGGHMKEQSWKNEAYGVISFEVIKLNVIKVHISVTKGSITSKNFEIFLRNLTHSWKFSCGRFLESFKWIADMKWEVSFYQNTGHLKTQICYKRREANAQFHSSTPHV